MKSLQLLEKNKNIHRELKDHQFQRGRLQFFPIRYTD